MAEVIPFPLVRRGRYVWRQATWFAEQRHAAAESYLRHQLSVQANALARKGVAPARVDAEIRALESAIRAHVARMVLTPGGAA